MAYEIPLFSVTFSAGADLSAATNQYRAVKLDASGNVIAITGITDRPIGILQNTPGSGQAAEVMVAGVSKVNSDAALAIGNELGVAADGQLDPIAHGTDTTVFAIGTVLRASGAAGGYATALVNFMGVGRAA